MSECLHLRGDSLETVGGLLQPLTSDLYDSSLSLEGLNVEGLTGGVAGAIREFLFNVGAAVTHANAVASAATERTNLIVAEAAQADASLAVAVDTPSRSTHAGV